MKERQIGEMLRSLRVEQGLNQGELAKILKINRTSISKYELNEREPSLEMLCNYADYFQVSTDYILGRKDF